MSAADNGTPAAAASEAAVAPSAAESVAPIAVPLPVAAPTSATATGAAAAASPATSATPVPVVRQPTMRKPAVSARMQRLKSSGDHLADCFNKTIHSSLARAEHNLGLTTALFHQTLTIVQDNGANMRTATNNFTETLPFLDALNANQTFPPIKAS